jgi:hypothetical protein
MSGGGKARPPGTGLLFATSAEIEAAPAAERDAYYAIVRSLLTDPQAYGFRNETPADLAIDDVIEGRVAAVNNDWVRP